MINIRSYLQIDPAVETERIVTELRRIMGAELHRRGAVVGISGGVDSSVVLALCVKAFGPNRVLALMMPERDSNPASEELARCVARRYGVRVIREEITAALDGLGCYQRRDEAIRRVFPDYDPVAGYLVKITLPSNLLDTGTLNVFLLTIVAPSGEERKTRIPLEEYLQIVAASNFKQRTRMAILYYHAEKNHYAVVGTGNKDEHELGFFVKFGDGGADVKPIVHLFKTQVYELARYLDVPARVYSRPPTSDTYTAEQTQEEFFFRLPFSLLDPLWCAHEKGCPSTEIAEGLQLTEQQVTTVIDDLERKQRTSRYLRLPPLEIGVIET